jgi:hypothetical protein
MNTDTSTAPVSAAVQPPAPRAWRWRYLLWLFLAAAAWLALAALHVWMGELNQDEGWYLLAARLLRAGKMPYRDFAFTQPPMMPLVYAMVWPWVGRFGLLGGRILTALTGLGGVLMASWLAVRVAPRGAQRLTAALAAVFCAVNVHQSYFTTVVKTYSLAALFLTSGLLLLSFVGHRRGARAAFAAGFLLACADATRVSLAPVPVLAVAWLLFSGRRVRRWAWLDCTLGAALATSLFVVPFALMGRDGFVFGLAEYHALRAHGAFSTALAWKVGCLVRLLQDYFPAFVAALAIPARNLFIPAVPLPPSADPVLADARDRDDLPPRFTAFLWLALLVPAAVHLAAPFPYDDYQVPLYPLFAVLVALLAARALVRREAAEALSPAAPPTPARRTSRRNALLFAAFALCALHGLASPALQNAFVAGRDRVWWRLRDSSPVAKLRDTAQWVGDMARAAGGTALLTQDTYLAVETGLDVPPGLEMGPFSYYPDWPTDQARRRRVMNRELLERCLDTVTNAPVAAFSGYGLAIASPSLEPVSRADESLFASILSNRFDHVEAVPAFGQASTTLNIWRLKTAGLPQKEAAALVAAQKKTDPLAPAALPPSELVEPVESPSEDDSPDDADDPAPETPEFSAP